MRQGLTSAGRKHVFPPWMCATLGVWVCAWKPCSVPFRAWAGLRVGVAGSDVCPEVGERGEDMPGGPPTSPGSL